MDIKALRQEFIKLYGDGDDIREYLSPGRVNLIGEHIDYNGGCVFPCALSFGTFAVARKREDRIVKFATTNFDLKVEVNLEEALVYVEEHDWTNYPKGVIKELMGKGHEVGGYEVLISGNIPNGAGLSSSASLEVLTGVIVNDLYNLGEDMVELVKLSQKAENLFVGVNCGIMDQFAVGMGKEDHAILLNCDTLQYAYAPLKLQGAKLIIGNTNKRRGLADSKYNERRSECEAALADLQIECDINALCDLNMDEFEAKKHLITSNIARNRAEHAVAENARVLEAVDKLKDGDIARFGELMNASHDSLKDLYEVTGVELDTMVEEARKVAGTIGSRMTGAGFGGCTISIVKEDAVDTFIEEVGKNYEARTGLKPAFYVAEVGQGARVL
ncbi:galactokinase [Vallitalea okinawensis]|uniref:galactokinase n=1 Tax=Vallitalea okinawensis TaxID=2078660 RepID=UPI001A9A3915|nr:galactokinase [Vallitalea okinawensis]